MIDGESGELRGRRLSGTTREVVESCLTWAAGDPPPRAGGALELLIDGGEALPRIAEVLSGARSHVHIAGW